ncbi:hypothetical protein IJI31_04125 [bacterium]|nr:hypothetical protein [bacterium]
MNQNVSIQESDFQNQNLNDNVNSVQTDDIPLSENVSENSAEPDTIQNNELLLGKFKSADELAKAYQEIQKHQGAQSKEIGELRKKARLIDELQQQSEQLSERRQIAKTYLENVFSKYNQDNYFKDDAFNSLFSEAFKALGPSLNMEAFVPLLENYVNSRINSYNKTKLAESETSSATDSLNFEPNTASSLNSFAPLNSLSDKDLSLALDQLI